MEIVRTAEENRPRLAASLELYSKHPLAAAVVREAQKAGVELLPVTEMSEKAGAGLTGPKRLEPSFSRAHLPRWTS
jgi:cation transport ATPase